MVLYAFEVHFGNGRAQDWKCTDYLISKGIAPDVFQLCFESIRTLFLQSETYDDLNN
jgi:hypothetical protein